jgi:Na+-driven multidrug efflux pump
MLQGWGQFLCLGVPSCLMLCLEWWFFECSSLLSGLLPNPAAGLVIFGICMQIMELLSMVAHGISVAVRTRVSNFLGVLHGSALCAVVSRPWYKLEMQTAGKSCHCSNYLDWLL